MGTGAYRSLAVLLTQNLKKGSKGLLELLKQESQEAFEERRRQAKTTGEKASSSDGHDACGCIGHTHGSGIFVLLCIGMFLSPQQLVKRGRWEL